MSIKKTIVLAGFMFLFAIFAAPVSAADNSCLDCHEKLTAFNEKEKQLNEVRIKHLQRDVACSLECHATIIDKIAKKQLRTVDKFQTCPVQCHMRQLSRW